MKLIPYIYDTSGSSFNLRAKVDNKEKELEENLYKSIIDLLEHRKLNYKDLGLPLQLNTQFGSVILVEECDE